VGDFLRGYWQRNHPLGKYFPEDKTQNEDLGQGRTKEG
jgi:hypothetical protein